MASKTREGSEDSRGCRVKQKGKQFLDLKIYMRSNNQSLGKKRTRISLTRELKVINREYGVIDVITEMEQVIIQSD